MLTATAHKLLNRQHNRIYQRLSHDDLLRRAEYLPELDKLLLEQVLSHGIKIKSLARIRRTSPSGITRQLREIKARLIDPCFLLTTHFADRLPREVRSIARSYFVDHLTLRQCAARHHATLHKIRQALDVVRSLLVFARQERMTASTNPADEDG